jgi:hypothetical protein
MVAAKLFAIADRCGALRQTVVHCGNGRLGQALGLL